MYFPLIFFLFIFVLFTIKLFCFDFSITNLVLVNLLVLLFFGAIVIFFSSNASSLKTSSFFFIPNTWQVLIETLYEASSQLKKDGEKYFPLIFLGFLVTVIVLFVGWLLFYTIYYFKDIITLIKCSSDYCITFAHCVGECLSSVFSKSTTMCEANPQEGFSHTRQVNGPGAFIPGVNWPLPNQPLDEFLWNLDNPQNQAPNPTPNNNPPSNPQGGA